MTYMTDMTMTEGDLTIMIIRESVGELYRMVQWWCHDQSNTFHYIKRAIEERYHEVTKRNKVES